MLLGSIMAEFTDESRAELALVGFGDLVLLAAIEAERVRHDETLGEYVSGAAQRFARLAGDEDWLGLMNSLERSDNPAASCLGTMLRWSLARDLADGEPPEGPMHPGCTCGGGGGCHEQA